MQVILSKKTACATHPLQLMMGATNTFFPCHAPLDAVLPHHPFIVADFQRNSPSARQSHASQLQRSLHSRASFQTNRLCQAPSAHNRPNKRNLPRGCYNPSPLLGAGISPHVLRAKWRGVSSNRKPYKARANRVGMMLAASPPAGSNFKRSGVSPL